MTLNRLTPFSMDEALALCSKHREKAKIIGGGTDLMVQIKKNTLPAEVLIGLENIRGLRVISYDQSSGLSIGAMTSVEAIEKSALVMKEAAVLAAAAGTLGNPLIRKTATIGGNLCNASPSADLAPACLVLGAKLKIAGPEGEKVVDIDDFFTGPGETILAPDEILTQIIIPPLPAQARGVYLKSTRSKGADLAQVGVAVMVAPAGGLIEDIKIALGAVAPRPIRAKRAEEALRGKEWDDRTIEEACRLASLEASCISDARASAAYREKLIPVMLERAVKQAVAAAP